MCSGYLRDRINLELIIKYTKNIVKFAGKATFEVLNSGTRPIFPEIGTIFTKVQDCFVCCAAFLQFGHQPISFFMVSTLRLTVLPLFPQ